MKHKRKLELGRLLSERWSENEEDMAEMAAYHVACEQLNIDPDDGWEYLALVSEESTEVSK